MSQNLPTGPITILFSDIVDSTALTSQIGDEASRRLFREHDAAIRAALAEHRGNEVKTMGDGFMAWFASVGDGVACGRTIQERIATLNVVSEHPIAVRVGLNSGEPIHEDDDLHGTAVIVAARVAAKAGAGEVLVTDVVRALLAGKQFSFADHGAFELKGIPEKMHLHRLLAEGEDAAVASPRSMPGRATVAGFTAGTVLGGAGVASAMALPDSGDDTDADPAGFPEPNTFDDSEEDALPADILSDDDGDELPDLVDDDNPDDFA